EEDDEGEKKGYKEEGKRGRKRKREEYEKEGEGEEGLTINAEDVMASLAEGEGWYRGFEVGEFRVPPLQSDECVPSLKLMCVHVLHLQPQKRKEERDVKIDESSLSEILPFELFDLVMMDEKE